MHLVFKNNLKGNKHLPQPLIFYIFATQFCRPLIFQTINSPTDQTVNVRNINVLHHQVAKLKGLEYVSLWQRLNSFIFLIVQKYWD